MTDHRHGLRPDRIATADGVDLEAAWSGPAEEMAAARGTVPTLVLSAEHDQFRPPDDAAAIAGTWPGTTLAAIEGADHFLAGAATRVCERTVTFLEDILA